MSNFQFLKTEWPELFEAARRAEVFAVSDPRTSCFHARRALELALRWMFDHDVSLAQPFGDTLNDLSHASGFRDNAPRALWMKARIVKDLGNRAVHNGEIAQADSTQAISELFHTVYWLARTYTQNDAKMLDGLTFDNRVLDEAQQRREAQMVERAQTAAQLQALQMQLEARDREVKELQNAATATAPARTARRIAPLPQTAPTTESFDDLPLDAAISQLKRAIAQAKKRNAASPDNHDYSEAQTRDYFIDLLLREAGWRLDQKDDREYPVAGMPNNSGNGFVDYVLWGDDGLPLAVVEAKKTKKDARIGRQQAKLYADCLEAKFGQRPLVFYTNGYEHWLWDDTQYPPRAVQGFYKRDELQLAVQRRTSKQSLCNAPINAQIVERYYQTEAIRAVCDNLEKSNRKALIVMATGAGKTRTVIALCDVLQRCNWAKRVLFLADRVALVNQAANAFKTHLPDCSAVNLVTEKKKPAAAFSSRLIPR